MTINELVAQAEENYRISKQELLVKTREIIDCADALIGTLKQSQVKAPTAEEVVDKLESDGYKYGEERIEVEDND